MEWDYYKIINVMTNFKDDLIKEMQRLIPIFFNKMLLEINERFCKISKLDLNDNSSNSLPLKLTLKQEKTSSVNYIEK